MKTFTLNDNANNFNIIERDYELNNTIYALGGDDTLTDNGSTLTNYTNDIWRGDGGNDWIASYRGNDKLFGQAGNDELYIRASVHKEGTVTVSNEVWVDGGSGIDEVNIDNADDGWTVEWAGDGSGDRTYHINVDNGSDTMDLHVTGDSVDGGLHWI